jgi:sigma-B regulation protein RsbQ
VAAHSRQKYGTLGGYAADVLDIIEAIEGEPVIFVGHSVSALIGVLASLQRPQAFASLVLVGPSPCYVNDGQYVGGFSRSDIEGLLKMLDDNHLGWSKTMAPAIRRTQSVPN